MFHRTRVKHVPMTKPVTGKTTRASMIGLGLSVFAQVVQTVKNLPPIDPGSIPGLRRSLEEEMVTNSSILAWENPWAEECGVTIVHGFANSRTGLSN